MKRRTFVKNGMLVSTTLIAAPLARGQDKFISSEPVRPAPAGQGKTADSARPAATGLVAQVKGASPYEITRRAVTEIGGMDGIVARGDVVMVKPNIGWNRTVEQAACTNPEVLRAIIELAFDAGAKKVIVMDNTCHKAEDCYQRSGIEAMARKAGAEVRYSDENRLAVHDFKGEVLGKWPVFRDHLEVDKFINVPVLKHHGSSGLTMAMKNLYGILGGNRGKLHRDMGENIADLAAGFRSHLVVIDAFRVLVRNGPVGGRLSDVELRQTVIASTHIMHADVAAAALFGRDAREVEFLQAAFARKMGEIDVAKIAVKRLAV
jgi:uncharacterized protein (DUF362 family)